MGGRILQCAHQSESLAGTAVFSLFLPEQSSQRCVPALFCLLGDDSDESSFLPETRAFEAAATHGLALVVVPAVHEQWKQYTSSDLPWILRYHFPVDVERVSLMGHGLSSGVDNNNGGIKALGLAMDPSLRAWVPSVSAFGARTAEEGRKDTAHAPTEPSTPEPSSLMRRHGPFPLTSFLIDEGTSSSPRGESQAEDLASAARAVGQRAMTLRHRSEYDGGLSGSGEFISQHIAFHADALRHAAEEDNQPPGLSYRVTSARRIVEPQTGPGPGSVG